MKYSDLKAIFAEEETHRDLRVIGLDQENRQVEALFLITPALKGDWEAFQVRYL